MGHYDNCREGNCSVCGQAEGYCEHTMHKKPKQSVLPLMGTAAHVRQVGGAHYKTGKRRIQHWDLVALFDLDYFQGYSTKYIFRWRDKGGVEDIEKAIHVLQRYVEIEKARAAGTLSDEIYDAIIQEIERHDAEAQAAATGQPARAP